MSEQWFYIQSVATANVISAEPEMSKEPLRSQVYVNPPTQTDNQLWRWEGHHLVNKATELVLDIRKGKLRLLEDTDICLYSKKPLDEAHNQLWEIDMDENGKYTIFSYSNSDWVLDTHPNGHHRKLVLSPRQSLVEDGENQLWEFIPVSGETTIDFAKQQRGRNLAVPVSSGANHVDDCRECHQLVYLENSPHLCDRTIGMAAAYHIWQKWRGEQAAKQTSCSAQLLDDNDPAETSAQLVERAREEAARIFDECDQLNNDKETALSMAARLVISLYQIPLHVP
ncbi:hypothetical protein BX666DRAFT_2028711 [Dichotomocladium elegans]|nr:hypothetical protein BX666DRAFT_2028711 [Dichotomocladium elegans]